ncbi:MAG: hypothetical protein ACREQ9_19240 [Candidatus Binatia bacterium]
MTRRVETRIAVLVACLAIVGCERAKDRTAEEVVERLFAANGRKADVAVDRKRGAITVDLGGVVAPPEWPREVPIYPGARHARVEARERKSWKLSVSTGDSLPGLARYYRDELTALGWSVSAPAKEPLRRIDARRGAATLVATFAERLDGSRVKIAFTKGT